MALTILNHPLAEHLMAGLRDSSTSPEHFRYCARRITTLLAIEATKNMRTVTAVIQTPLEPANCQKLAQGLSVVPVLRAGLGMLEPIVELFPDVSIGYVGLERDHLTAVAQSYYLKLPEVEGRFTLCVDPMLATGGSASTALSMIKKGSPATLTMVAVVAAPEGVERLQKDHPDVSILVAALDRGLNENKYILPGLGDFGDRLYGTT